MLPLKVMLVEDSSTDVEACESQAAMYKATKQVDISFVKSNSFDVAISTYDSSFDGAIIDLKLGDDSSGGNKVIDRIVGLNARIPVCITTGTPANAGDEAGFQHIPNFIKGEFEYSEIFDIFTKYHKSGITKIFSAKGTVEELLRSVYYESILPQKNIWFTYGECNSGASERGLLRHTINNMLHRLDENSDVYYKEEFYISPPNKNELKTGCIVSLDSAYFIVLTPACDLVPREDRNWKPKTSHITLVEIDPPNTYIQSGTSADEIKNLKSNSKNLNLHYLPPSSSTFQGGFINFRKVNSRKTKDFYDTLKENSVTQVSPFFVKDIIARFSTFYARQGQPDFDIT